MALIVRVDLEVAKSVHQAHPLDSRGWTFPDPSRISILRSHRCRERFNQSATAYNQRPSPRTLVAA